MHVSELVDPTSFAKRAIRFLVSIAQRCLQHASTALQKKIPFPRLSIRTYMYPAARRCKRVKNFSKFKKKCMYMIHVNTHDWAASETEKNNVQGTVNTSCAYPTTLGSLAIASCEEPQEGEEGSSLIRLPLDGSIFLSSGSFFWFRAFLTRRLCLQRRSLRWVTIVALGVGLTRLRTSTAAASVTMRLPPFLT